TASQSRPGRTERSPSRGASTPEPTEGLRSVRPGRLWDAVGQVRAIQSTNGGPGPRSIADLHAARRRPADPPRPGGPFSAANAQPAGAFVLELHLRERGIAAPPGG